jgi:hypothetical protein
MKNQLIFVTLVMCLATFTYGQTGSALNNQETIPDARHLISLVPQYLATNGLRVDYDIRLNQNHWLQFGPTFYLRNNELSHSEFGTDFRHLIGSGLHVYHRYYPGKGMSDPGIYISWGGVYQNHNITYDERLESSEMKRYSKIQKVGGDVIIGIYTRLFDPVMIDFYAGMGLRHSFVKSDAQQPKKFDDEYIGYGYTGNILILGFRLSLPF